MRKNTQYKIGLFSEKLATFYLSLKGYKILQSRYKTYVGEIDLLVCKGKTLIAVEIKHRRDIETAFYAIAPFQQNRIQNALQLAHKQFSQFIDIRCDTILISPFRWPIHIKNAF